MFGFGKGKIEINLPSYNYSPGDTIDGTVILKLNAPIKAKGIKIRILGNRKSSNIKSSAVPSSANRTNNSIVYDFTQPLDGEIEYSGESSYNFKIKIPKNVLTEPNIREGIMGTLVKSAQILSGYNVTIDWHLITFLDIPMGLDVSKKVQINIA